jgi:hypothetical protein
MSRSSTVSGAMRLLRRPALVVAVVPTAVLALGSPASAHNISLGDTYTVPVSAISSRTVDLVYSCDDYDPSDCTPKSAATPGTEAAAIRLVWALTGAAEGAVVTLENGLPTNCSGKPGIRFGVESTGGTATATLKAYLVEENGLTGSPEEQTLFEEYEEETSPGGGVRRVICFP